jgi:hypothetical protein
MVMKEMVLRCRACHPNKLLPDTIIVAPGREPRSGISLLPFLLRSPLTSGTGCVFTVKVNAIPEEGERDSWIKSNADRSEAKLAF